MSNVIENSFFTFTPRFFSGKLRFSINSIKKAILCLLVGGVDKTLPGSGQHLRGYINILLIGDPCVAKSQLLRYVLSMAPIGIGTTGSGTTGAGLTVACTGRQIDAGAMVLADRGVVCIDEFDKIRDRDRTVLLEPMEQGTITITKAAIRVKVNVRTSVLAAANPIGGRYKENATLHENIGLDYALVSRFDLVFVMKDVSDRDNDTLIAANVIRNHRYRNPKEIDGEVLDLGNNFTRMTTKNEIDENDPSNTIYEMYNPLLHGPQKVNILSSGFFKKY